jgi:23S rRNA maturation-related 3'-5' exoribonuclease YhaM
MAKKKEEAAVAAAAQEQVQDTVEQTEQTAEQTEVEEKEQKVDPVDAKVQENRKLIIDMLKKTGRDRIDIIIEELEADGFFTAPASGGYHSNQKGGLAQHSLNVMLMAEKLGVCLMGGEEYNKIQDSVVIVALLHDLGKVGDFDKSFYIPNMIQDGRPTKADPVQKYKQSDKKPWKRNPDLTNVPHGVRSAIIAERYFELTEEEEYAIMYHDGMYEPSNKYIISGHETPLLLILHWADMWASRVIEGNTTGEGDE